MSALTIKDIAKLAGVSIATVSHVVNKTRYVAPPLVEKVTKVIDSLDEKPAFVVRRQNKKKYNSILCFTDNVDSDVTIKIIENIKRVASEKEFQIAVCNNFSPEIAHEVAMASNASGIIYISSSIVDKKIIKATEFGTHSVIIGGTDDKNLSTMRDVVVIDYYDQVFRAMSHLVRRGHEDICLLNSESDNYIISERKRAFIDVLTDNNMLYDEQMIFKVASEDSEVQQRTLLNKILSKTPRPTAIICSSNDLTVSLLKYMRRSSVKCPEDVSVISFSESIMDELVSPGLTTVYHDAKEIGEIAFEKMYNTITSDSIIKSCDITKIDSKITVRESTQSIGRGPRGEKAESTSSTVLSENEIETLKNGNFTAVLAFHHSGTTWSKIHEKSIKDAFLLYGIKILAVMNAHYDPAIQTRQLEGIVALNPDVLISVPTDDIKTASPYQKIAESSIKIVFINNVPVDFDNNEYTSCISVNERENGRSAGEALGQYMTKNGKKKVGFIIHGADFFATKQRDMVAQQALSEEFDVEIVDVKGFIVEENAYAVAKQMITENPSIEALYVSWDIPAIEVMRALKELNRTDIGIVTTELDIPTAISLIEGGMIKAIIAQRLYRQGTVIAQAAGCALLNKNIPKYIGVNPFKVTQNNLLSAWQEIMDSNPPDELVNSLSKH